MKCLNIRNMPDELHRELKILSAERSKPMAELIFDLIRKELKKSSK
jgi:plasmid stability protein